MRQVNQSLNASRILRFAFTKLFCVIALLEYFAPLSQWLARENAARNDTCGWITSNDTDTAAAGGFIATNDTSVHKSSASSTYASPVSSWPWSLVASSIISYSAIVSIILVAMHMISAMV